MRPGLLALVVVDSSDVAMSAVVRERAIPALLGAVACVALWLFLSRFALALARRIGEGALPEAWHGRLLVATGAGAVGCAAFVGAALATW